MFSASSIPCYQKILGEKKQQARQSTLDAFNKRSVVLKEELQFRILLGVSPSIFLCCLVEEETGVAISYNVYSE